MHRQLEKLLADHESRLNQVDIDMHRAIQAQKASSAQIDRFMGVYVREELTALFAELKNNRFTLVFNPIFNMEMLTAIGCARS